MVANGSGNAVIQYKRTHFEAGTILPDAPVGGWRGTVLRGKSKVKPNSNGEPMVTFQLRIDSAEEAENESYQGTQLPLFVSFPSDSDGATAGFIKRRSKMTLNALSDQCGFDLNIVPEDIGGDEPTQESVAADLAPFVEAVEGRELDFWTTHRDDKKNPGLKQVDIHLSKPGSAYGGAPQSVSRNDEDDAEADDTAKPKKNGKSKRR